jgi:hypothetical protein
MKEGPFDLQTKPARVLDLWKVDEQEDPEYPAQVISASNVLKLNRTATLIWKLIDGHHSVQDIIDGLCQECVDADPQQVAEDTVRFLEDFERRSIIDLHPDPLRGL